MSEENSTKATFPELPAAIEGRLRELADTLKSTLGDNLVSLVVFGSAARGGWKEGRSDVDLVLVLREASREALLAISNTMTVARTALRFEAVLLTAEEIPRAADVFPLFYDDIRSCHVLLAGKDAFADLEISDKHRRLRIEQELREMQIRLRRAVVDSLGAPQSIAGAVERKVRQMRGPMHALLLLKKTALRDDTLPTLLEAAKEAWGVDVSALSNVRKDAVTALDAVNQLLGRMIDEVDRMEG